MKIDVHNHIGFDPEYEIKRGAIELIKEMEETKINKCIVFPFTSNPDLKAENKHIKQAIDKYPDQLIGFCLANPRLPEMIDLIYEYYAEGFKGIVTDPRFGVDHGAKQFHELVECALTLDLPMWLHSDDKDTMRVYISPLEAMLGKYPQVKFILSSMYYDAAGIATKHKNVFLDTASAMSGSMTAALTQPVGTHRILMGSNTPYGLLIRELDKLDHAEELTDFQRKLIYSENVKRLLKL